MVCFLLFLVCVAKAVASRSEAQREADKLLDEIEEAGQWFALDAAQGAGNFGFKNFEWEGVFKRQGVRVTKNGQRVEVSGSASPPWEMELDLSGERDAVRAEVVGAHTNIAHGLASARAGAGVVGSAALASTDYMSARALATAGLASAGAGANFGPFGASASAKAIHAGAGAQAECRFGECGAGVYAEATTAKAEAALSGVPVLSGIARASASGPTASAGARVDLFNGDATVGVGAHAGEACGGPFCARAGVKFGGGLEGGIPVLHLGFFSIR